MLVGIMTWLSRSWIQFTDTLSRRSPESPVSRVSSIKMDFVFLILKSASHYRVDISSFGMSWPS